MNGELVDRLVHHTRTEVKEIGGHSYTVGADGAKLIKAPVPAPLEARSLTAVVDYVARVDRVRSVGNPDLIVQIESPTRVAVYGDLMPDGQRPCYLVSTFAPPLGADFFGRYHDAEAFIIAIQSTFKSTDDLANVLKITGTLESEAVATLDDDGVSQKATIRSGIVHKAEILIHNPMTLAPFRTFAEIEQPASAFILRLKGGGDGELPKCALIVADGNAWQLDAMAAIRAWLGPHLPGTQIIS